MTGGAWMRAEILEQPARWRDLLARRAAIDAAAALVTRTDPQLVLLVARGSSDHAAMYAQYLVHAELGVPAALTTPASITAHGARLRYPRSVALAISQSGTSPDLLATVRAIAAAGVPVATYTNGTSNILATLGDAPVDIASGAELAVAATKTYSAELLALALTIYRATGRDWSDLEAMTEQLADAVESSLRDDVGLAAAAAALTGRDRVLVVGRGLSMASAKEGALKLMETTAIAASGWSAADAIHGPLGQVVPGASVVLLTTSRAGRDSVVEFGERAAELGAEVIEVGPGLVPAARARLDVPAVEDPLVPLAEIVPLQRLALELATGAGRDPDRPPGLAKVTLTT